MIKGVELLSAPLFSEGVYSVYVGYITGDATKDIPHYLVVNDQNCVVEGSSARYFEARAIASAFSKELVEQNEHLNKGREIVERAPPESQGEIKGEITQDKKWKQH